ncbi:MAG: tRNA methyl transferase PRC-barrel domain-containing protein, partial [Verrucomicrobiota bacterium]
YGRVRRGEGVKVRGGIARSYFIEAADPEGRARRVCVMSRDTDENVPVTTPGSFRLQTNEKVRFTLYSSATRLHDRPGDIVDPEGRILGRHRGLHRYTMGQRRGIGVPSNTDNEFYVVVGFNMERNELIVAFENPDSPGLYTSEVELYGLSFVNRTVTETRDLLAKPRYRDPSQAIRYRPTGRDTAQVTFARPQRALAAGQILALYDGETLLGGGFYR